MRYVLVDDPQSIRIDREDKRITHLPQRLQAGKRKLIDNFLRLILQNIATGVSMTVDGNGLRHGGRRHRAKSADGHVGLNRNRLAGKLQAFIYWQLRWRLQSEIATERSLRRSHRRAWTQPGCS